MERLLGSFFRRWSRGLQITGTVAALSLMTGVLTGGGCYVSSCDDDDDDWDDDDFDDDGDDDDDCWDDDDSDDDDDDDAGGSSLDATAEASVDWQLRDYRLIPEEEPGAHPVRSLVSIRGFSLTSKLGPGIYGDPELQHFTSEVLRANEELIGLPDGPGRLRFDAIEHPASFMLVTYVQELVDLERDVATVVPGAALTFVFDLHGRLIEIDGTLRLDAAAADGAVPGTEATVPGTGASR